MLDVSSQVTSSCNDWRPVGRPPSYYTVQGFHYSRDLRTIQGGRSDLHLSRLIQHSTSKGSRHCSVPLRCAEEGVDATAIGIMRGRHCSIGISLTAYA
eukprot:jgi/Botrbrau1/13939/Bobra.0193s0006.1